MARRGLTQKQASFLDYLKDYVNEEGDWPTYREISDAFGFRSPNSVTQNLQADVKLLVYDRTNTGFICPINH